MPAHGNILDSELGKESREPFGVDPTYVSTESLYRASNTPGEQYEASELKNSDTPYGFFYDGGCIDCSDKQKVRDFPVMFDVNFNVSRTEEYLTMLKEGGYIDSMTSEFKVCYSSPILFNSNLPTHLPIYPTHSPTHFTTGPPTITTINTITNTNTTTTATGLHSTHVDRVRQANACDLRLHPPPGRRVENGV